MAKNLVIVESPAKARTLDKILGKDFDVTSSMGHLRDLPRSRLGVDVENNFEPHYIVIQKRRKFAKELQAKARDRHAIFLAPDPDREGEAISWHLARLLRDDEVEQAKKAAKKAEKAAAKLAAQPASIQAAKKKKKKKKPKLADALVREGRKIYRITFHEITPQAVKDAVAKPTEIDLQKVDAQQARRVLDRLVGYSLSPLLWKKIGRGLSAGRVQSVTLRLIVDREKEIEAFTPQEYWTIEVDLRKQDGSATFKAQLDKIDGKKADVTKQDAAERIVEELKIQSPVVSAVQEKEQKRYPKPPLTTSTLQQESFKKLGYASNRTMRIAQQLYEGIEIGDTGPVGLITYMRTDSVRVADVALRALRAFIPEQFGKSYLPESPRKYKSRKTAQEAHEAVRPTDVTRTPEAIKASLTSEQMALYQLIWQRFVASQMADAIDKVVSVAIAAGKFQLKSTGRTNIFPGWTKAYEELEEKEEDSGALPEGILPPLTKDEPLDLTGCAPSQHFTKPPQRFTDASLVKALEEDGVGRPSTYAPTIQTLLSRDYMRRTGGSFVPTKLGWIVTDLLIEHFPEIMDITFTAGMEEELDRIEEGHLEWVEVVRHFYTPFAIRVATAQEKMQEVKREVVPTDYVCEKCGKPMVIKWGRFGQFLSCSAYPDCKNAKPVPTGVKCPEPNCNGELVERRARGRHFYGCMNYPTCRYTARRLPKEGDEAENSTADDAKDTDGETVKGQDDDTASSATGVGTPPSS